MTKETLAKRMTERFAWFRAIKRITPDYLARIEVCLLPIANYGDFSRRQTEFVSLCILLDQMPDLDAAGLVKGFHDAQMAGERLQPTPYGNDLMTM